jgi:transcriptional regulator with XRE-family HTH domain
MARAIAARLGSDVRAGRLRLGLSQDQLARRVGVHQTWISRIELGHGGAVSVAAWVAIGVAVGRPFAASLSRPLVDSGGAADAGHLAMQERLLQLAHAAGRTASVELPTRPTDPRHSIDVCVKDARHRTLIIQEAWNTFSDVGAAIRSTNRKVAEAADLAAIIDDGPAYRVASVWVVRPSAANRRLVARYPHVFGAACPGSSRLWVAALFMGAPPPMLPGLVWLDPSGGRLTAWRRGRLAT